MNWIKNSLLLLIFNFIQINASSILENSTIAVDNNNNSSNTKINELVYIRPTSLDIGKRTKNEDDDFRNALLKALSEVSEEANDEELSMDIKLNKLTQDNITSNDNNNQNSFSNHVAVFSTTHIESKTEEPLDFISKSVASATSGIPKSVIYGKKLSNHTITTTAAPVEIKTEENEAKVEQVQFFSAPLVAAFTVHQNEQGQAHKVEPIFKNNLVVTESEKSFKPQTRLPENLQQKQRLLEQELENIRKQQTFFEENFRNNIASSSNNIPTTNLALNHQFLLQKGFNQGKTDNLKLLEPVFSEPDRSVITKLVSVDPDKLIDQNIITMLNNPVVNSDISLNFPRKTTSISSQEINLVPSVTLKPQTALVDGGLLPNNRGIDTSTTPFVLPNFRKSVEFRKTTNSNIKSPFINFNVESIRQDFKQPATDFNPSTIKQVYFRYTGGSNLMNSEFNSNFKSPEQNSILNKRNPQFGNQQLFPLNQIQQQSNRFNNNFNENSNFPRQSENHRNRFLRQEPNTGNFGINQQNSFSIQPAIQSYFPQPEFGSFELNINNEIPLAPPPISNNFNRDYYNVYRHRFL